MNTVTRLPDEYANVPSSAYGGAGASSPSSSANSRRAASRADSESGSYSPFGIDQAPASFAAQYGPPMWAISTSGAPTPFPPPLQAVEKDAGAGHCHGRPSLTDGDFGETL